MYQISSLKNGLTLITIDLPHLNSITSLVAVGAGSRYETKKINGISHFLEHMFFKGSKKFPSAEQIAELIDGVGAINNASTSKEWTFYWIKSAASDVELAADILSSMIKESLLTKEEIEREKGVIVEELRMYRDNPARYVWDLYERLQFGDQPLGWETGGDEEIINCLQRADFQEYMSSLYSPKNMALVFAGHLPKDTPQLAEKHFANLKITPFKKPLPYEKTLQKKPRVDVYYKKTDQANVILGVEAENRDSPKRYALRLLAIILGEGMSSRLFVQVRERRGLAYHVHVEYEPYLDTGVFAAYAGLKLEKVEEGIEVIRSELERLAQQRVSDSELKKAKEMERGHLAIRQESTNFLAEHFGTEFVLDRKVESFPDYLKKIDQVSVEDIRSAAAKLFSSQKYNLQIIGPFKNPSRFAKILK